MTRRCAVAVRGVIDGYFRSAEKLFRGGTVVEAIHGMQPEADYKAFDTLGGEHMLVKKYRGELARLIH